MGIVPTATHPIFSFHGVPVYFSSLILSSKPHICAFHFFSLMAQSLWSHIPNRDIFIIILKLFYSLSVIKSGLA